MSPPLRSYGNGRVTLANLSVHGGTGVITSMNICIAYKREIVRCWGPLGYANIFMSERPNMCQKHVFA